MAAVALSLVGIAPVASAQTPPPECTWEWGGVAEASPAPCASPVPAHVTDVSLSDLTDVIVLGFALLVFVGGYHVVRTMSRG